MPVYDLKDGREYVTIKTKKGNIKRERTYIEANPWILDQRGWSIVDGDVKVKTPKSKVKAEDKPKKKKTKKKFVENCVTS